MAESEVSPEGNTPRHQDLVYHPVADNNFKLRFYLAAKGLQARLGTAAQLFRIHLTDDRPQAVPDQGVAVLDPILHLGFEFALHADEDADVVEITAAVLGVGG